MSNLVQAEWHEINDTDRVLKKKVEMCAPQILLHDILQTWKFLISFFPQKNENIFKAILPLDIF